MLGALLDSILTAPLDPRVREQIISETRGIPLAMLELLRDLTPAELAGGFGLAGGVPVSGQHRGDLPAPDRRSSVRFSTPVAARGGRSCRRPAARLARGRAARYLD